MEVFGEGVRDEDAMEGGAAAGVEVYFLEGAEAVVVEGEIDGEVDVVGEVVVGGGAGQRGRVRAEAETGWSVRRGGRGRGRGRWGGVW